VPILYIDGKPVVGQSKSIERFLAARFGLNGDTDIQAAQIDMVGEHVRDIKDAYQKAKAGGTADAFLAEELPKWAAKLEAVVTMTGEPGFAVGCKLSLAGIQVYSLFTEFFDNKEAAEKAYKLQARLAAIVANVAGNDKIKAWQASRPASMF
jgi:glutathione S-transferase